MKKPYLIQRMNFKGDSIGTIDQTLSMDYMGSAEFEFGALPKSLKHMCKNVGFMVLHKIDSIKSAGGEPLYLICSNEEGENYRQHMPSLVQNEIRTKESHHFDAMVKGSDYSGEKIKRGSWMWVDAWWDVENNVMFTFGEEEACKIHDAILATRDKKEKECADGWF